MGGEVTRYDYGGTSNDVLIGTAPDGSLRYTSGMLTFWNAETGGDQYTDLVLASVGTAAIPVAADGQVPRFQGPDGVTRMWADGGGNSRVLLLALPPQISVGTTAPGSPAVNDLWIDTN